MNNELYDPRPRIQAIIERAEGQVKDLPQMSGEWKQALETLQLARAALRADQIGDIRVVPDPQRHGAQPEFNHPDNLKVFVGDSGINYLIDEPDVAMLFGLAFKYLERNDAPRFVAFAARMLGIESGYAKL